MFVTTTLPYINSAPHIGHAFEFVLADALVRANKSLLNRDTFFNIGLDEHGLKVWQAAHKKGVTVQDHVAEMTETWFAFCNTFDITYDKFYKTSSPEHHVKVQQVWNTLLDKGDIYKKSYTGDYCVGCEAFKQNKDLTIDGLCPDHPTTQIQKVSEENYFFRLSNYVPALQQWLANSPDFLQPANKLDELNNLLSSAEDISISRKKEACPWGVAVPNDDDQVVYVWFDALLNYIFAAGDQWDARGSWHNGIVQFCGPDNLRFQAVIFQSFLAALGKQHTTKLLVHGTIVDANGQKISKSLGNGIDPLQQVEQYGLEAVRYYMLGGLNTYQTSSWNQVDLVNTFNSEVVNDWGNIVARVLHMIDLHGVGDTDTVFVQKVYDFKNKVHEHWENFEIREAVKTTNELIKFGNKYINDEQAWVAEKKNQRANLYALLKIAVELYKPILPSKYDETKQAIEAKKKVVLFKKLIQ